MRYPFNQSKMSLLIAATLLASSSQVLAADVVVQNTALNGAPAFVTGELGKLDPQNPVAALKEFLSSESSYGIAGNEDFKINKQWTDELGKTHTRFDQTINGIKVYGTRLTIHGELTGNSFSQQSEEANIYAVTGQVAVSDGLLMKAMAGVSKRSSKQAIAAAQEIGDINGKPELAYVYLPLTDETKLAWRIEVSWDHGNGDLGRDFVYYDAVDTQLLTRDPQMHSAKSWRTHTLNGGSQNNAPGTLLCTNNQSCGNTDAQRAHDGAAKVYDFYQTKFGRDSINGQGMTMISSVDLGDQNAYWTGSQMLYGKSGNGISYTADFDVIGHELTHGVTQYEGAMEYKNASGALNEAWSDIMGVTAEAYKNGTSQPAWLLGDGLYTQPGQALRYMANPTQDGRSKDWWPEHYPYTNNPNNSNDRGGVHLNSGIANLAYVLLVQGGTHPRNKSPMQVPGIGMDKAMKIFYRALTTYLTPSSNFAAARSATEQAAQELYGTAEKTAVSKAWCAVGVEACPSDTTQTGTLANGVTKTGISGSNKQQIFFTLAVPAGATNLKFVSNGGSGDADIYAKFGAKPTLSSYDCAGNASAQSNETCTISNAQAGTYYVMVEAYTAISSVSLTGSYSGSSTGPTPINDSLANISVGQSEWAHYTQVLGSGYSTMTVSISGGSGDADLFLNHGSQSTATNWDCRPYLAGNNESCTITNPAAGTWYIDLNGYSNASGVTLTLTAN